MNTSFCETKLKVTEMYNKYRAYYDCEAEAKLMALFFYSLILLVTFQFGVLSIVLRNF